MAEIKAHEFDQFVKRRSGDYRLFLIYGPDRGLVSERAEALARQSGVDLSDAFSFMRLDASDLTGDPGRLFDEARSPGLFGGSKLIWIKSAGADKGLSDAVSALAIELPESVTVLIEAGDLKKGANLRKAAETSHAAVAIPCYADDARSLNTLIDSELAAFDLGITSEARQALLDSLGGDRIASRNEIRKLAIYAKDMSRIELKQVLDIVGDASAVSADDAVDCILAGDRPGFMSAMQKVTASKTPIFLVLQGCLRMFQLLDVMRSDMDEKRLGAAEAMNIHGRHLHFRRRPCVEGALKSWSAAGIASELNRLQHAVLLTRQRASLEDSIATHTLLATTLVAARTKSGR